MTAIKQTSVCSEKHLARLRDYLSWDRDKALAHGTQNIIDDDRWFQEMADTRAAMGHDRPGKAGAKCTYMQHQILGFLPDECDLNGGKMTPELCMRYAREYVAERYPNQEVVMVRHRPLRRAHRHQPQQSGNRPKARRGPRPKGGGITREDRPYPGRKVRPQAA